MSKSTTGPARTTTRAPRPVNTNHTTSPNSKTRPGQRLPLRRRHPVLFALVPLGLVVAVVATMVVIKATGGSGPSAAASSRLAPAAGSAATAATNAGPTALSPSVTAALTVSPSTLDAVGSPGSVTPPSKVGGGAAIARDANGKALITYVGAEYCPYCAAERWALAVALSRFGTFSNLSGTHSSSSDVFPDTQTLSFYGSHYSSPSVDFQPVEEATNQPVDGTYQPLQAPTAAQSALVSTYDPEGDIPFIDIANRYVVIGASYSPQVLQGLTRQQIAAQLDDPSSAVAQAIDGAANDITAAICAVTGNQPSSVASSSTIQAIERQLEA
jgi:hypothetical protein